MRAPLRPALVPALGFFAAAAAAFVAAYVTAFGASAQDSSTGLDVAAIRARAAEHTADAEALAATVRRRGDAMIDDARATASEGAANGKRLSEAVQKTAASASSENFDFDKMVADAGTMDRARLGQAPRFIAFASTSMPAASLKAMVRDVTRAGGVVVFRGLPGGNVAGLVRALRPVFGPGEPLDHVGIDPRLFRAFNIDAVPAYVLASSDFELCDGFDCATALPPHDRIAGNVSVRFALETFANGSGPSARLAALHLARLEETAR